MRDVIRTLAFTRLSGFKRIFRIPAWLRWRCPVRLPRTGTARNGMANFKRPNIGADNIMQKSMRRCCCAGFAFHGATWPAQPSRSGLALHWRRPPRALNAIGVGVHRAVCCSCRLRSPPARLIEGGKDLSGYTTVQEASTLSAAEPVPISWPADCAWAGDTYTAARKASALSVRSHVNTSNWLVRPKWPYAEVVSYIGRSKFSCLIISAGFNPNTLRMARSMRP